MISSDPTRPADETVDGFLDELRARGWVVDSYHFQRDASRCARTQPPDVLRERRGTLYVDLVATGRPLGPPRAPTRQEGILVRVRALLLGLARRPR